MHGYMYVCVFVCRVQRKTGNSWVKAKASWLNYFGIWKHLIHPNFGKHYMTICWHMNKKEKSQWGVKFRI